MAEQTRLRAVQADDSAEIGTSEQWRSISTVHAKRIEFLLPRRIVAGSLCILEGHPGTGKSTFLAALAASVTTGRSWLGRPRCQPSSVLWLTAEEEYGALIRPRLEAAGADVDRVYSPSDDRDGIPRSLTLSGSLNALELAVRHFAAKLLVIEPLLSYLGVGLDPNSATDMRSVLDPLQRVCMATGCTAVATRLLRKQSTGDRINHGQGSGEIGGIARSVLVIERPEADKAKRILRKIKCYGAGQTPALAYTIQGKGNAVIMDDLHELTPEEDEDYNETPDPSERDARGEAKALLINLLHDGWVRTSVVEAARIDALISPMTLRRAKADLHVRSRQRYEQGSNYHEWALPDPVAHLEGGGEKEGEHEGKRVRKPRKKSVEKT